MAISKQQNLETSSHGDQHRKDKTIGRRLTLKQQRFVEAYIRNGGNGSRAVIDAGYNTTSERSIRNMASENLPKPLIRLALEQSGYQDCGLIDTRAIQSARGLDRSKRRVSSKEDRAEFLTRGYEDNSFHIVARLKALELLGKMYGDYLERVVLKEEPVKMPVINFNLADDD